MECLSLSWRRRKSQARRSSLWELGVRLRSPSQKRAAELDPFMCPCS